jgi:hypothetical protein
MAPETRFHVSDAAALPGSREEVLLESGLVQVEVPRLPPGHTFAVRTPDALVTVHGTAFSVDVTRSGPSGATTTKVVVAHGVVSVLHASDAELLLYAGMEWSSSRQLSGAPPARPEARDPVAAQPPLRASAAGAASAAPARARRQVASLASPNPAGLSTLPSTAGLDRRRDSAAPEAREVDAAAAPASTRGRMDLANQNALFTEAKQARASGDQARAVDLLNELVQRFPGAPLAEDAHVEIFRAIAQAGDRAGAARAARRYLTLYPGGFARDEARALALEPGGAP